MEGTLIELAAAELSILVFLGGGRWVGSLFKIGGYRVKYGGSLYNLCYLLQALHLLRLSFFSRGRQSHFNSRSSIRRSSTYRGGGGLESSRSELVHHREVSTICSTAA